MLVQLALSWAATAGSITSGGLYTAPASSPSGAVRVIARAGDVADTARVWFTSGGFAVGIPFGPTGNILGATTDVAPFTAAVQGVTPSTILGYLAKARTARVALELNMTGGHHNQNYATGGDRFDLATWKARMDAYNTPAIKAAVAAAVMDGTIIGNSVMDEPHVHGGGDGNTHGPQGWMTKAVVDQMCAYAKAMFPTLPVGVAHNYTSFEPTQSYRVCEFVISQYVSRLGTVTAWRDGALAMARRDGYAVMLSMNVLNGGAQDRDGTWDCAGTGGKGTYSPNCRMTAIQIRDVGLALGPSGCAFLMWRYDPAFMANADNRRSFTDIAVRLASAPRTGCVRL